MILAAGTGTRLRPLTDTCPKPLICVNGTPLLVYHIEKLVHLGLNDIVINVSYLADKIIEYIGSGEKWGAKITYSHEPTPLEVGGGIFNALSLLGEEPFILVNGDIWTDYDFIKLPKKLTGLAHLVLVENPEHNMQGDFSLDAQGMIVDDPDLPNYTYAGIAVLHPKLFCSATPGCFPLRPLLQDARKKNALTGEYYNGLWTDVGTVERLQNLENTLTHNILLKS